MAEIPARVSPDVVPVLFVEDHSALRRGLRVFIERDAKFRVCAEAETVARALEAARTLQPQVAIVDLALGGNNGLDLISALLRELPGVRILVLSMHSEDIYQEPSLRAGALGYLTSNTRRWNTCRKRWRQFRRAGNG